MRPAQPPARPAPRRGTGDVQRRRFSSVLSYSKIAFRPPAARQESRAAEPKRRPPRWRSPPFALEATLRDSGDVAVAALSHERDVANRRSEERRGAEEGR